MPMKHLHKINDGTRAETIAFVCLGMAGVMTLCFAMTSMFHFVDGIPNVVARLEEKPVATPSAFAAVPNTNLVTKTSP